MLDRAPAPGTIDTAARPQTIVIGSGKHGRIVLDRERGVVTKHYNAGDASMLQREHDTLLRFGQALSGQPHVRCPQASGVDHAAGTLRMTFCQGMPIDDLLADPNTSIDDDLEHIARQIAIALTTYIKEFGTPYYDLAPWNMLYDTETRTLSLVDFASDGYFGRSFDHLPVEGSLGKLTGGSIYQSVRPSTWRNACYRDRQRTLVQGVLAHVQRHSPVDMTRVAGLAALTYDGMGKQGSVRRQLWYRTLGQVLYTRRIKGMLHADTSSEIGGVR